jgi:hypothetical protein
MEEGGRSEEKRHYAVNSKQKLTKNSCLVGSFLMCGLAGSFYQNLLLRTNEVEDGGILFWDWGFFFRGHLTFVEWHVQRYLCYQVRPFHQSINQSPPSGQTNQGSLFEPRNTSPPWQKNHKKYFKDLVDRGRL